MKKLLMALLFLPSLAWAGQSVSGPDYSHYSIEEDPHSQDEWVHLYNKLLHFPISNFDNTGSSGTVATSQGPGKNPIWQSLPTTPATVLRSYLSGLQMTTTAVSSVTVAVGVAADSTNAAMMTLSSSLNKSLASTWVVGDAQGGLDTGTVSTGTWYHVWLIERTDTSNVDVLLSTSAIGPTLPASYTLERRIGAVKTDASSHILQFVQDGDVFTWAAPVTDVSKTNPGTSAITQLLASVPTGIQVRANVMAMLRNIGSGGLNNFELYLSDLATTDTAPSTTFADIVMSQEVSATAINTAGNVMVRTNTSGQIRYREGGFSDANTIVTIITRGWTDTRGRDQ